MTVSVSYNHRTAKTTTVCCATELKGRAKAQASGAIAQDTHSFSGEHSGTRVNICCGQEVAVKLSVLRNVTPFHTTHFSIQAGLYKGKWRLLKSNLHLSWHLIKDIHLSPFNQDLVELTKNDSRCKFWHSLSIEGTDLAQHLKWQWQGGSLSAVLCWSDSTYSYEGTESTTLSNLVHKAKQTCVCTNDFILMARNLNSLREMFGILEETCQLVGLGIDKKDITSEVQKTDWGCDIWSVQLWECKVFQLLW